MPFYKHRDERRLYRIIFTDDLAGATITSVDLLEIMTRTNQDVTAQFLAEVPTITLSSQAVDFFLERAAGSEQAAGSYKLKCRVIASSEEEPIALTSNKLIRLHVVTD